MQHSQASVTSELNSTLVLKPCLEHWTSTRLGSRLLQRAFTNSDNRRLTRQAPVRRSQITSFSVLPTPSTKQLSADRRGHRKDSFLKICAPSCVPEQTSSKV